MKNKMDVIRNFYENYYATQRRKNQIEEMEQNIRVSVLQKYFARGQRLYEKILIVGCGSGKDLSITTRKIVGIDISSIAIEKVKRQRPQNTYLVADACDLPFSNNLFDCAVCSEVIEHVTDSDKLVFELQRVLREKGTLVITAPNWHSFYGMARILAEFIIRRPVTSGNQPIDNWYTRRKLRKQLNRYFRIEEICGIWYFPPIGKGKYMVPSFIVYPIFKLLQPIERFLGRVLPWNGHLYAVRCIKKIE